MTAFKKDVIVQIVGAIIGSGLAILGAWSIFNMTRSAEHAQREINEQGKIESSARATFREIESNKLLLKKIITQYKRDIDDKCEPVKIKYNYKKDIKELDDKKNYDKKKYEHKCYILFALFSDQAWASLLFNGGFTLIKDDMLIKSITEHYVFVQKANYIADKVKYGRYNEFEGELFIKWCEEEYERIKARDFNGIDLSQTNSS